MFPSFSISCKEVLNGEVACSVRKGVLRNFAKLTWKHLRQSLFLIKLQALQACNFIKKETLAQVFSCEFCKISNNSFFTEYLRATASVSTKEQKFTYCLFRRQVLSSQSSFVIARTCIYY